MKGNSPLENVAQKIERSWGGEVQNVSVLVAIGVNSEGYREILGVAEGSRENKESWSNFLRYLKERGLKGVKLVISDKAAGLADALGDFFPETQWQRCVVHWYRNAFSQRKGWACCRKMPDFEVGVIGKVRRRMR